MERYAGEYQTHRAEFAELRTLQPTLDVGYRHGGIPGREMHETLAVEVVSVNLDETH